ncbi:ABC transporter ATP-binding protein [Haloplasma contractile]|uniref:Oligopeptide ABC transporter ATP-binding protein n=1 Tax=Haloplasma contractile SSD-17B TaxID=1033810 RepID=U2DT29_9MOLU|nr:oligopeptide/dipeptide ABC transporter ATP-binding protein [Haloplasma contractile]ERJ11647.1 Oligopeptide ABC transporter ATP-binding protein [Haloplasma contractile SSD-17B]
MAEKQEPILEIKNLKKHFVLKKSFFGKKLKSVHAVDDISFTINRGETFGLVGESGCGKSTTGRTITKLYENTAGEVYLEGEKISAGIEDLKEQIKVERHNQYDELAVLKENKESLSDSEYKSKYNGIKIKYKEIINGLKQKIKEGIRINSRNKESCKRIQMIFQDPYASLNPRMTVTDIIAEGINTHKLLSGKEKQERIYSLLEQVGLKREHASRYPHEFSGGQRQRIGIARALAINPDIIICDEPISALDVSIQAQVVNMLEDLQKDFGLTYLFIAHDLSMVKYISDRIGVMYLGKMMEIAESDPLYDQPLHPYTKALLSSIPLPDPEMNRNRERMTLEGDVPSPINPKPGCRFASRCRYAKQKCKETDPVLEEILPKRFVACHYVKEINNL